jgi:cytochrome P450
MAVYDTLLAGWSRVQDSLTLPILLTLAFVFAGYYIVTSISLYLSRRKFRAENACQSITNHYPSKWFGINFITDAAKSHGQHRYLDSLTDNFRNFGYTHEVRALGGTSVWTIEPENIKAMLTSKFKDYSLGNRPAVMGPLLGHGVFITDGEEWSHSRALLRPNFAKEQVADLSMIERHLQQLLNIIPDDGNTIELQELLLRFTLDSSTEFLFGESTETLTSGANREFSEAFAYSLNDVSLGLRLGPWHKFRRTDPKAVDSHRICREYADKYVNHALEYRKNHLEDVEAGVPKSLPSIDESRRTFLRELAMATDHREKLRDELLSLLLAGRDTTASLIGSLLFSLARNPEMWEKVKAEVRQTLHGVLPTYEQLRNMKYPRFCVNESRSSNQSPYRQYNADRANSLASLPSCSKQRQDYYSRHSSPTRRWPRRHGSNSRSKRHSCHIYRLLFAPTIRHLWRGRRGIPTRTLGESEMDLGQYTCRITDTFGLTRT